MAYSEDLDGIKFNLSGTRARTETCNFRAHAHRASIASFCPSYFAAMPASEGWDNFQGCSN